MSGRTKTILYHLVSAAVFLAAAAAVVLLACFRTDGTRERATYTVGILLCFFFCLMLLPLHTVLHELGHVFGGGVLGMRVVAVSFGIYCIDWRERFSVCVLTRPDAGGATVLLPKRERGARGKLIFSLLCGAAFDFVYAAVILTLYFTVAPHPAMQFFALFAPLCVYEGIMALYPAELPAGSTDGKFALGLIKKAPEAEVSLRVMTAQGLLYTKQYGELPHELLFGAPVVREDSTAFAALLQLQWRYLYCAGEAFAPAIERLKSVYEFLPEEGRVEVAADLVCYECVLSGEPQAGEEYRADLIGSGAAVLRGLAALDPTADNLGRAQKAAEKVRMAGERDFGLRLLEKIKNPRQGG